jgi:hypothetical protein
LQRVLDGAVRLCRLAGGAEPARTPHPLCAWCVGLPGCGPGQERAGTDVTRRPGEADEDDDASWTAVDAPRRGPSAPRDRAPRRQAPRRQAPREQAP